MNRKSWMAGTALAALFSTALLLSSTSATAVTAAMTVASQDASRPAALAAPLTVALAAPDIDVNNVKAHLQQPQPIATNNGGNRATGTAGHTQSAAYVKQKLEAAGYTVTMQTCTTCNGSAQNVIADWPGGNTSSTYMFGAHLDS